MLEILQFYVSGFWVWLGITAGIYACGAMLVAIAAALSGLLRK